MRTLLHFKTNKQFHNRYPHPLLLILNETTSRHHAQKVHVLLTETEKPFFDEDLFVFQTNIET